MELRSGGFDVGNPYSEDQVGTGWAMPAGANALLCQAMAGPPERRLRDARSELLPDPSAVDDLLKQIANVTHPFSTRRPHAPLCLVSRLQRGRERAAPPGHRR